MEVVCILAKDFSGAEQGNKEKEEEDQREMRFGVFCDISRYRSGERSSELKLAEVKTTTTFESGADLG
jgi:hypothetical protein